MGSTHFDQIADEISHGDIDRGLWIEAFVSSDGDQQAARAQYIKLRARKLRELGTRVRRRNLRGAARRPGALSTLLDTIAGMAADLWTVVLWMSTFAFAVLTTVGLLCLGTLLYLKLYDEGTLAWSFVSVGSAFLACFLFGRGVQRLVVRPPTALFYLVELLALGAVVWPLSHLTTPAVLGHLPRALNSVLVFLVVRFLNSGDPWANTLTVAALFLPVYGIISFVRQRKI